MKFLSTSGNPEKVTFREAVLRGLAPDKGLYYPETIPELPSRFFNEMPQMSLPEIGFEVLSPFTNEDLESKILSDIINETLNFPIPLVELAPSTYTLELFHGPTFAFKDVGARFLARCLGYFANQGEQITVLVATSGDTGSAVGHGFLNVSGVKVKILYPSGKVSKLQEQQLTTLGHNIEAFEVSGTFDDCQRLVKEAFTDRELNEHLTLTSANSINIARWLPQSIYYFWAVARLNMEPPVISVPSGNYGNIAGGLLAKAMGLPIKKFIAASNANDVFPQYLASGQFNPRDSVKTLSNAMDVGNPSNYPRILEIYDKLFEEITGDIYGISCPDEQTISTIRKIKQQYNYLPDPHGAVGYYGLEKYREQYGSQEPGIFLETAHPAKFHEVLENVAGTRVNIPEALAAALGKPKHSIPLQPDLGEFKKHLLR